MTDVRPIVEEIRLRCLPARVFERFKDSANSIFLDSGMSFRRFGRFSIILSDPFLVFKAKGRRIEVERNGSVEYSEGNPLTALKQLFFRYKVKPVPGFPVFTSGAVGYFGYDLGWQLERLPTLAADDLGLHDIHLGFYDWALIFDNIKRKYSVFSTGLPEENGQMRRLLARERIKSVKAVLRDIESDTVRALWSPAGTSPRPSSNFQKTDYMHAVEKIKRFIAKGDIYQANLSQRFTAELTEDPYELYKRLRAINPAPFASFHNLGDISIISASPERFLRISGRDVTTRPIKGTRPRGRTVVEDKLLRRELLASEKDRAELVMIVDLERNDLGRVCDYGSVRVEKLISLERYSTVFHLVSTVCGRLHKDKDHIDCIKACFPGGSITGAPKIRAMEILEEIEPTRRGVYTGAIGYLGFNGETDLNIAIRTMVKKGGNVFFHVGGGIVADSIPASEYEETLHKARALIKALRYEGRKGRGAAQFSLQGAG